MYLFNRPRFRPTPCCLPVLWLLVLWLSTAASLSVAENRHTILVLGDSISAAYGIDSTQGWVSLLDHHLQQQVPPSAAGYRVINASISGETTVGALSRLPELLQQYQPDTVIIELGGNDGLRGYPIAQFRRNLEQLVELSLNAGANVLLAGMRIPPNYGRRYTEQFYDSYAHTAQKFDVPLIPFLLEDIAVHSQLMQGDGIHPTAEAQPRILQTVLAYLRDML